jgi:hypothetical protein
MAVVKSPFESRYGFKGPGFSVDDEGNIIANSIITATAPDEDIDSNFVNFTVTEANNDFSIAEAGSSNPTITLARQSTYTFLLDTPNLKFSILSGNQIESPFYSTGLSHSDGSTGEDSQNKADGTLRFAVPLNAPDTLYYADEIRNNFGIINIIDPVGLFSSVNITDETNSTSATTGALKVAGGVGIAGDLWIDGNFNVGGTGISNISSGTNLELEAVNEIVLKIDGTKIGVVSEAGLNTPIVNTTINNTVIGGSTPSTAAFTSATVNSRPTADTDISNKTYVDSTALALSIAFGL